MIRILIAEDEEPIREGLTDLFEAEGFAVLPAADGNEAVRIFRNDGCDCALLDIMMPGVSGYDVCRVIRESDLHLPVLLLSAREEEIDKVLGLELGADDYIVKPFGVRELVARVRAVLRRAERADESGPPNLSAQFAFGNCTVDTSRYTLKKEGAEIELTAREVDLLSWFYANPDVVHTRDDLLLRFWGTGYGGTTRTLDQHIAKLRRKIEDNPARPAHILTVHGAGYRFRRD
jgi:DNA-binding response OmpR family regulator